MNMIQKLLLAVALLGVAQQTFCVTLFDTVKQVFCTEASSGDTQKDALLRIEHGLHRCIQKNVGDYYHNEAMLTVREGKIQGIFYSRLGPDEFKAGIEACFAEKQTALVALNELLQKNR